MPNNRFERDAAKSAAPLKRNVLQRQMKFGIDRYIGNWKSEDGYRLEIRKVDEVNASVSLFSPFGAPISRPYYDGKVTVNMPAIYDDHIGDFDVHLWKAGGGFCLNLNHEYSNRLDELHEEILVPALSRYEEDNFLDAFDGLFGNLKHYRREERRTSHSSGPGGSGRVFQNFKVVQLPPGR